MKKVLTLSAVLLSSVFFTACGDKGTDDMNSESYYEQHDYGNGNSNRGDELSKDISDGASDVKDGIKDAIDDVEEAGENVITDVSSAISDMVEHDTETTAE